MSCAHTSAAEEKEKRRHALAKTQHKWLNETGQQISARRSFFLFFFFLSLSLSFGFGSKEIDE
jgi:hypothetical protein